MIQSVGYRGGGIRAFTHHVIGSVRSVWRTQDDSLAGLTFGQWVHLLPKPHAGERNARVILWNEALEPNLSPYGRSASNRRRFQSQALAVKELRNRATHRRPLVKIESTRPTVGDDGAESRQLHCDQPDSTAHGDDYAHPPQTVLPTEAMGGSSEFTGRWIVGPAMLHAAIIDGTLAQWVRRLEAS